MQAGPPPSGNASNSDQQERLISLRSCVIFAIALIIGLGLGVGAAVITYAAVVSAIGVAFAVVLGIIVGLATTGMWLLTLAVTLNALLK